MEHWWLHLLQHEQTAEEARRAVEEQRMMGLESERAVCLSQATAGLALLSVGILGWLARALLIG